MLGLGSNLKKLREDRKKLQKEIAAYLGLGISHYSKIENDQREASVEVLDKPAKYYQITIDQIVHMEEKILQEVFIENEPALEQMKLLEQLNEEDRRVAFRIIDKMLNTKKFQTFFEQNLQTK